MIGVYENYDEAAAVINAAYQKGCAVTIDGRSVKTWGNEPAKVWGTGSLSVDCRARSSVGKINPIWYKAGSVSVEVRSDATA